MTSPALGGPAARPARRLVWAALILSLLLNLMFIGGLVWLRSAAERARGPGERIVHAARELNLTSAQQEALAQFRLDLRRSSRTLKEKNVPVLDGYFDEVAKASPDREAIARTVDQADGNRRAFQSDLTNALLRFMATLSPEQRAQFVAAVKRPPDPTANRLRHWLLP